MVARRPWSQELAGSRLHRADTQRNPPTLQGHQACEAAPRPALRNGIRRPFRVIRRVRPPHGHRCVTSTRPRPPNTASHGQRCVTSTRPRPPKTVSHDQRCGTSTRPRPPTTASQNKRCGTSTRPRTPTTVSHGQRCVKVEPKVEQKSSQSPTKVHGMSRHVMSSHVTSGQVTSGHVRSGHVMSGHRFGRIKFE